MQKYENTFLKYIGARSNPNQRELDWVLKVQGFSCKAKYIPGIEMLSICNSVSFYASNKNSDIDLFVITRPGYIWLVRLLLNILAYLSGVRRPNLKGDKKKEVSGKICLSFFVANNHLNLTDLAIKNDIYLYFWLRYLKPIISRGEIYSQFLLENCIRISPEQKKENTSYQIIQNIQKPY